MFYFLHEPGRLNYDFTIEPAPADRGTATFHRHAEDGDECMPADSSLRTQPGSGTLEFDMSSLTMQDSPVFVLMKWEKNNNGEMLEVEKMAVFSLAEPEAHALNYPADAKVDEAFEVGVSEWGAIAYDSPNTPAYYPSSEVEANRVQADAKAEVKWQIDGEQDDSLGGDSANITLPDTKLGKTVVIEAFRAESPLGVCVARIAVPAVSIFPQGSPGQSPTEPPAIPHEGNIVLEAAVEPQVPGTFTWEPVDTTVGVGDGNSSSATIQGESCHVEGLEVTDSAKVKCTFTSDATGNTYEQEFEVKVKAKELEITACDEKFAPEAESCEVTYKIAACTADVVKLQVFANSYEDASDALVFERELTDDEKADGEDKKLQWPGSITEGGRKDRHVTPLMSPFKVVLIKDDALKSEKEDVKVLYHSIELGWGKHTPDGNAPPDSEANKWAKYRLNALHYWAGPVNDSLDAVAQGAIKRFQRAHYKSGTTNLLTLNGSLDADTKTALASASARACWESGKNPLTEDCKHYVDDNYMNDRSWASFNEGGIPPEFNSFDRKTHVEDKLERAFLPLEVTIKLQKKDGSGAEAPDAVGEVKVAWECDDGTEDASVIPNSGEAAKARTYVGRAIAHGNSANRSSTINDHGDNAPNTHYGFRDPDPAKNIKTWFPDDAGSKLEPFTVSGYETESRDSKDHHRAIVKTWDHATDHQDRKGKSGVYLRLSHKAGDDGKVRAAISFEGHAYKDDLVTAHESVKDALVKETGRWTVWRRTRINAYCKQAAPNRTSGDVSWPTIRDNWKMAFLEVENNGSPQTTLNYGTIVTEAAFKAAISGMTTKPPGVTNAASVNYNAGYLYGGGALPAQNPGGAETAAAYVSRLQTVLTNWVTDNVVNTVLGLMRDHVRKTYAEGFIIYDYRIGPALTGQDWDAGTGAFKATTDASATNQRAASNGWVRADGAVTMNLDNPFNVNCYLLHECSHARFLYHHITGGAAAASDNVNFHDADQKKCAMSYAIGDTPNNWNYPLCGKCMLRLRGWQASALPNQYT